MASVNFGIIGTGNIAQGGHGNAFLEGQSRRDSRAKLWSVCSREIEKARAYATTYNATSPHPAYDSIEQLLEDPDLHAVLITSPDKLHFEHAAKVAKAKKHILLEKPMVTESHQGEELVRLCEDNGVILAVAYHLRWHAGHRQIVEAIHKGTIGHPHHVRVQWSWKAADASNWRASKDLGQWWSLAGVGTHCLDLARWILLPSAGEVEIVSAVASNSRWKSANDELAVLTLRFENGATAEICSSSLFAAPTRLEVYGSDSYFLAEDTLGRHGQGSIRSANGPVNFTPKNPFLEQLENFANSILDGQPVAVGGVEGIKNANILLRAMTCPGYLR